MGEGGKFINPAQLSIPMSEIEPLRRRAVVDPQSSGNQFDKTDIIEIRQVLLKLQADLLVKQTQFQTCFEKLTSTAKFSRAVEMNLRAPSRRDELQITPIMEYEPPPPKPRHAPLSKNISTQKKPRPAKHDKLQESKPKRNINKAEKPKDIKRIEFNDKDIWKNCDQFWSGIPRQEEVDEVLSIPEIQPFNPIVDKGEHWSIKFSKIAQAAKDSKKREHALLPPAPPPRDEEEAKYWRRHPPLLPAEDLQLTNSSSIHRLLSSLVEVEPIQRERTTPKKKYLSLTALPPRVPFDPYMSLTFEDKLNLELKSIGLEKTEVQDEGPFYQELLSYQAALKEIEPRLKEIREEIDTRYMEFKHKEEKRRQKLRFFFSLVDDHNNGKMLP